MNFQDLLPIVTLIIGVASTLMASYLNHRQQLKRDKLRYAEADQQAARAEKKEEERVLREDLTVSIQELQKLLWKIKNSANMTAVVKSSTKALTVSEFDVQHTAEKEILADINALVVSKFPDLIGEVRRIDGYFDQYWGILRSVLMNKSNHEPKESHVLFEKIVAISSNLQEHIATIENHLLKLAERITKFRVDLN